MLFQYRILITNGNAFETYKGSRRTISNVNKLTYRKIYRVSIFYYRIWISNTAKIYKDWGRTITGVRWNLLIANCFEQDKIGKKIYVKLYTWLTSFYIITSYYTNCYFQPIRIYYWQFQPILQKKNNNNNGGRAIFENRRTFCVNKIQRN